MHLLEPRNSREHVEAFAAAVRAGLSREPKTLPFEYFYDDEGSRLFEAICKLPEYYVTRTEDAILRRHAPDMVKCLRRADGPLGEPTLVELGSGSAVKTRRLLAAALKRCGRLDYVPIDVSASALEESAGQLARKFPGLGITGYVADYRRGLERIMATAAGPRLIVFLGSSLGNYTMEGASDLLSMIGGLMGESDRLLLGTDMAKDAPLLEAAYDDSMGVTAAFNLNLLHRMNRELAADFRPDGFRHRAVYRPDRGRVEMHLVSLRDQSVQIPAARIAVRFREGETIHTESSHKYTLGMLAELRGAAGFVEESAWTDHRGWFRLQLWRRAG
ncbi:L-histidine N(alpha)-methyltransferase [Aquisphaera giovannonii]|nr:L-histidine N(alpha)-methyltransferase [Aquisphaera giovannonii]